MCIQEGIVICHFICILLIMTGVGFSTSADSPKDDLVITLERTACFGSCPVYKLTVRGDGSVTYEGRKFVRVVGPRQATVDKDAISQLTQAFVDADYFALNERYRTIHNPNGTETVVTDLPTTYTSITLNGRHKAVEDYVGAPEKLRELEKRIDEAVGSKRFVYIDSSTVHEEAEHGWDIRSTEAQKLLLHAAEEGDADVVRAFIKEGADVNLPPRLTPLQVARGIETVRLLIAASADVNATSEDYYCPPLVSAIQGGDPDSMKALIEAGAKVNGRSPDGETPLMEAARSGVPATVKLLLQTGADAKARTASGEDALKYADRGLDRQTILAKHPGPFAKPMADYQSKFGEIKDMLIAAGDPPAK